jgi:hypothetical protein
MDYAFICRPHAILVLWTPNTTGYAPTLSAPWCLVGPSINITSHGIHSDIVAPSVTSQVILHMVSVSTESAHVNVPYGSK